MRFWLFFFFLTCEISLSRFISCEPAMTSARTLRQIVRYTLTKSESKKIN
ncbi:hypothetical protein HanPI659440_Chr08g0279911 [Helianthus annuus]|nr:hypothetical protein HanPI659440_Chr08g0279911 [Helianthus annuus]